MSPADKRKAILAAKMMSQASAFQTKGLGVQNIESGAETKSESQTLADGGSEASGHRAGKQNTRDGEESEGLNVGVKVSEIAFEVLKKKKKKKRKVGHSDHDVAFDVDVPAHAVILGIGTGGSKAVVVLEGFEVRGPGDDGSSGKGIMEKIVDPETATGGSTAGGSQVLAKSVKKIGKKTLSELAAMANEIPDSVDWKKLKNHDMMDNLRGRLALWAQEGIMLAGDRHIMAKLEKEKKKMVPELEQRDKLLFEAREEVREKDRLITQKTKENEEVQDDQDACYAREHTLNEELGHAKYREKALKNRVEKAEEEVVLQKRKVVELVTELDGRMPEDVVIREYKESDEHLEDLMGAAAADL